MLKTCAGFADACLHQITARYALKQYEEVGMFGANLAFKPMDVEFRDNFLPARSLSLGDNQQHAPLAC